MVQMKSKSSISRSQIAFSYSQRRPCPAPTRATVKMGGDKEYELTVLTLHLEKLVTDFLTQNQSLKPKQHNLSGILSTEKKKVY